MVRPFQPITPQTEARIIARYTAGEAAKTIADEMGLPTLRILRFLRRNGVPIRPRRGMAAQRARNADILRLRDEGYSMVQIGEAMGVSKQRIHQIVKRGY